MGWENPPIPWAELERRMSGRSGNRPQPTGSHPLDRPEFVNCDGGDAPGWSRKRPAYETQPVPRPLAPVVDYAELHAHSDFSFLDGASDPEDLVEEAVRLGLHALAITDHDGFYAAPRFAEAADRVRAEHRVRRRAVAGADRPAERGRRPGGRICWCWPGGVEGYHALAAAITVAQLRGDEKGRPVYDLDELADAAGGHWQILTGAARAASGRR